MVPIGLRPVTLATILFTHLGDQRVTVVSGFVLLLKNSVSKLVFIGMSLKAFPVNPEFVN